MGGGIVWAARPLAWRWIQLERIGIISWPIPLVRRLRKMRGSCDKAKIIGSMELNGLTKRKTHEKSVRRLIVPLQDDVKTDAVQNRMRLVLFPVH